MRVSFDAFENRWPRRQAAMRGKRRKAKRASLSCQRIYADIDIGTVHNASGHDVR